MTIYRMKLGIPLYFQYLSGLLGVISLIGTVFQLFVPFAALEGSVIGHGGIERLTVYPLVAWEIILGIFLLRNPTRLAQQ